MVRWDWGHELQPWSTASVDAITVSHSLEYATQSKWPSLFADMFRVLVPGGVLRITETEYEQYRYRRGGNSAGDGDSQSRSGETARLDRGG